MSTFDVNTQVTLEEGQQIYQSAMQQAAATLHHKGMIAPNPPTIPNPTGGVAPYRGELPADLTRLTDDMLGTYMGLLTEWSSYVGYQLAEADTNLTAAKEELNLIECRLRLMYQKDGDKKRSNPERDDYVGVDRRFVEIKAKVRYWDAIYNLTRAVYNGAEGAYAAVSRRVTQRGQEVDRLNRTGGVTGHGNIPAFGPVFGATRR